MIEKVNEERKGEKVGGLNHRLLSSQCVWLTEISVELNSSRDKLWKRVYVRYALVAR